jgi:hypothetical protein
VALERGSGHSRGSGRERIRAGAEQDFYLGNFENLVKIAVQDVFQGFKKK